MKRKDFFRALAGLVFVPFAAKAYKSPISDGVPGLPDGSPGQPLCPSQMYYGEGWRHGMYTGDVLTNLKVYKRPRHGVNSREYIDRLL